MHFILCHLIPFLKNKVRTCFDLHINNNFPFFHSGTSKINRDKVLDSLNNEYGFLINQDMSIDEAYSKMVSTRPRRLLSKHDYNNNGVPFRSARCTEEPKETDVSVFFLLKNIIIHL